MFLAGKSDSELPSPDVLPSRREPGTTEDYYRKCPESNVSLDFFLKRRLSPEDAAHCRLKTGRNELTADLAFDDEDEMDALRVADPIADVGKSGRAPVAISGKSSWPETDGGLSTTILLSVFKEEVLHAVRMSGTVTVTFGEQHAKALSRLLVFVGSDTMDDVDRPIMTRLMKTFAMTHPPRTPELKAYSAELRRDKLRGWVDAARASIDERQRQPQRRSRASYDLTDEQIFDILDRLEEGMQPDVLTEFFNVAKSKGMGTNTIFNAAKGLQGIIELLRGTVIPSNEYGGYTVFGTPDVYLSESQKVLLSVANTHGRQRRKMEAASKAARETGYYLANIYDVRRLIFDLIHKDLEEKLLELNQKAEANAARPDGYAPTLMSSTNAGHLRGIVVAALQTSSPPLRVGAYAGLTQLSTARALLERRKTVLKRQKIAEEEGRELTPEELNCHVLLSVNDKTSQEHGHAGIKIDGKTDAILDLWLCYGRRHLGGEAAATSIPLAALRSRAGLTKWCQEQQLDPSYSPGRDVLLPTKSGTPCNSLGAMTLPVYNFYIQLDLNTTSMRR